MKVPTTGTRLRAGARADVHDRRHSDGGDAFGDEVDAGGAGGDLDDRGRDESDHEGLRDSGANDQDCQAEGGDDEFGGDGSAGDRGDGLTRREVEDEAGSEQDGKQDEALDVEAAPLVDGDGAGSATGLERGVHGRFLSRTGAHAFKGGQGRWTGPRHEKGPRSNRRPRVTWMGYGYEDSPSTGRRRVMPPPVVEGDERDLLHDDGSFRAIGGRNVG